MNKSQQRQNQQPRLRVNPEDVRNAIEQGGEWLVKYAERIGTHVARELKKDERLTTSQIRNIFGEVKRMEMKGFDPHKFAMLKAKVAYAAARAETEGAEIFRDVIVAAVDAVGSDADKFPRFVDLLEAILAYHKAAGGK